MSNSDAIDFANRRAAAVREVIEGGNAGTGNGGPPDETWTGWRASVDARLESLKVAIDSTRWVVGMLALVMIGGFGFLGFQLSRLEGRIDRIETAVAAIPARLSEEFRAMRAEMAAQTSAIANSITAVRQAQPPPPQVIVIQPQPPGQKPDQP